MELPLKSGKKPGFQNLRVIVFLFLAGFGFSACEFKLPSPPPDLFYKFNVLPVGQGPVNLLTADLNLDGNLDIVSANSIHSSISILYGTGDGGFKNLTTMKVPDEPTFLASGDINHDEIPDLLVNSRGTDVFSVLPGNKNGTFEKILTRKTGRVPLALILDDFNNDDNLDVAATLTFYKMEVFMGNGFGRFKKGKTYLTGSRSSSGVSEDFNGDGNKDIALAVSSSNSSSIRLFWGNGDGTFSGPTRIADGLVPLTLIKKDMNNDGIMDLICASGKGDNLYMFYSNGDGTFQKEIPFWGAGGPISLVAEHFNQDTRMDVAVANSRSSSFSLAIRNPTGLFIYPTRDYIVDGGTPLAITSGDYDSDGMKDIAVASNSKSTVEIFLQRRMPR